MTRVSAVIMGLLFCLPSLAMIGRSSLPLFSLLIVIFSLGSQTTVRPLFLIATILVIHSIVIWPHDLTLYAGRMLTLIVAFGCYQYFINGRHAMKYLLSKSFHSTIFYVMMIILVLEILFKLTQSESVGEIVKFIRMLVVSEEDASNFRNGNILLYFQEQSFVPYFALYAAAVYRFLGIRRYGALVVLLIIFHKSGTFVLFLPFILGLLLPRIPFFLLPLLFFFALVFAHGDEFLWSRAERVFFSGDIDDSTFSRIIPFLAGFSVIFSHPLGVGVSNYGAAALDLLEPFFSGVFGGALISSLDNGWLGYKLYEDGRLSYTSQLLGIFIEFGWLGLLGFVYVSASVLGRIISFEDRYYRMIVCFACIGAFSFSMPIMFPFIYIALALGLRVQTLPSYSTAKVAGGAKIIKDIGQRVNP